MEKKQQNYCLEFSHQIRKLSLINKALLTFMSIFLTVKVQSQTYSTTIQTNPFTLTNSPSDRPASTFADLDQDGDIDILMNNQDGIFYYYENVGDKYAGDMAAPILNPFGLSTVPNGFSTPNLVDLDADGDLDVITSNGPGNFYYYENIGSSVAPTFTSVVVNPFGLALVNPFTKLSMADLDGDGDLDMMIIAQTNTEINFHYFQNTGSISNPAFASPVTNPFSLISPTFNIPFLTIADFDVDGDPDIMVLLGNGPFEYFENNGSPSSPSFLAPITNPFSLQNRGGTIGTADFDADGDFDILVGERFGSYKYFENTQFPIKITWDGETSTDWNQPTNWVGDLLPLSTEAAVIPYSASIPFYPTITADIEVFDLEIETDATATISSGSATIERFLNVEGDLIVTSGASLIPVSHAFGAGAVTIIRNTTFGTTDGKFSIVGSPIAAATTDDLGSIVYGYDEEIAYGADGNARFQSITTPEAIKPGDAYFSGNTGSISFVGMPTTGTITTPLSYNALADGVANAGYNLVSNPYSAPITLRSLTTANTNIGTIYLWDDGGSNLSQRTNNDYITVTGLGATGGSGRSGDWDGSLRSAQGFFVKVEEVGNLTFTPSMMKTIDNTDAGFFRRSGKERQLLRLSLSSTSSSSDILIGFDDEATLGFDRLLDGQKIMGTAPIELYTSLDNKPMAIQGFPFPVLEQEIGLRFNVKEANNYKLSLTENQLKEFDILLVDHLLKKTHALSRKDTYSFSSSKISGTDRFSLTIVPNSILSTQSDLMENKMVVYSTQSQLIIQVPSENEKAAINIYDPSGQLIYQYPEVKFTKGIGRVDFKLSGFFILKVESKNQLFTKKFIK